MLSVSYGDVGMVEPTEIVDAHEKYALPLAFSRDEQTLYSGGFDGMLSAWKVGHWTEVASTQAHQQSINCGAVTSQDTVVTGSTDTTLGVWPVDLAEQVATLTGHEKTVAALANHPTKPLVASASYDTTVRLWNLEQDVPPTVLEGHERNVTAVRFASEGSMLLSGGIGDEIVVWSVDDGEERSRLPGHGQAVSGITVGSESQVWSVGYNGEIHQWSGKDWSALSSFDLPGKQVPTGIAVNQRTGDIAVSRHGGVLVLNLDGEVIEEHQTTIKGIYSPLWSSEGGLLCVGGADGKLRIYQQT